MILDRIWTPAPESRLLPAEKLHAPTVAVMAIMTFAMIVVAAAGLALANSVGSISGVVSPWLIGVIQTQSGSTGSGVLGLAASCVIGSLLVFAVPAALDNPILLPEPLSPHLAAAHAGVTIALPVILDAFARLRAQADAVVVEGAGGFLVPLTPTLTGADLAVALGLPLVLVVGMRLGCLNHALLSAEAIRARGLTLAGWIANRVDPDFLCPDENLAYLREHLGAPLWADLPFSPARDPRADADRFTLPRE